MHLDTLLAGLPVTVPTSHLGDGPTAIHRITEDSRRAGSGALFVARRGVVVDGHDFIGDAIDRGATAILCRQPPAAAGKATVVIADDPYAVAVIAAHRLAGRPCDRLHLTGITGTNGKSTTAFLICHLLAQRGRSAGLIGTLEYRVGHHRLPAPHTTPDALRVVELLGEMAAAGSDHAVMEVSSHGLDQGRVAGCHFHTLLFTNLTQDHLDYHGDMESYFAAKTLLFRPPLAPPGSVAVINTDDSYGARLADRCAVPVLTYGLGPTAAVRATDLECSGDGSRFALHYNGQSIPITMRLLGEVNVYNGLAAAAFGIRHGWPLAKIGAALATAQPVPGRYQRIGDTRPVVVVDYAHTPDALARAVADCRRLTRGRLIVVFGCGGDRDRSKRPLMGAAAAGGDIVILTSDNPRSEPPARILAEIEPGLGDHPYTVEVNRAAAIEHAIAAAAAADLVLIAGKGHEDYQLVGDERRPFDDRAVAAAALARRAAAHGVKR